VPEHRRQDDERVLLIVAHPDDAEFWLGGTIAKWSDSGVSVTYCVLTDGANGGFDPAVPRSEIPSIRQSEQKKAASLLAVKDVRFLARNEGELCPHDHNLHAEVVRIIRQVRPHRVVTWSPEWNWKRFRSCHPDHRATGEIALRAVYPDAGNPFALTFLRDEEGLDAWTVGEAWLINSPNPNHYVDITEVFSQKVAAVAAHQSQVGNRSDLSGELRERIAANAHAAGVGEDRLVEAFQVIKTG
jgi:LmbE family N-acetylglucosaminyl deacetylase